MTATWTGLVDAVAARLDDHHRAVFEIAHALARLFAGLDDADLDVFAGQEHGLQGVGQVVEVDHRDALQPGDLVEVVVVGDQLALQVLGQRDQLQIDRQAGELGQIALVDHQLDVGVAAEPVEDVQPAPAAAAAEPVGTVGNAPAIRR